MTIKTKMWMRGVRKLCAIAHYGVIFYVDMLNFVPIDVRNALRNSMLYAENRMHLTFKRSVMLSSKLVTKKKNLL